MENVEKKKNLFWQSLGWFVLGLIVESIIGAILKIDSQGLITYGFVLYKIYKYYKSEDYDFDFLKPKSSFKDKIEDVLVYFGLDLLLGSLSMMALFFIIKRYFPGLSLLIEKVFEAFSGTDHKSYFGFVLAIIGTGLLAPIVEEIIFRGFLYDKYAHLGKTKSMLINTIIFGLIHGGMLPPHYLGGLLLFSIRDKQGDIYGAIGLHMINNIFVEISFYLPTTIDILGFVFIGLYMVHLFKNGPLLFNKKEKAYT